MFAAAVATGGVSPYLMRVLLFDERPCFLMLLVAAVFQLETVAGGCVRQLRNVGGPGAGAEQQQQLNSHHLG
jgi:hypothetical protein